MRKSTGSYPSLVVDATAKRVVSHDVPRALLAINTARAALRARAWDRGGVESPGHQASVKAPLIIRRLDATLIAALREELAAATFKPRSGHHPTGAWVDHGQGGTGEPVAMTLRKGNAGSKTAADHIEVTKAALRQLPSTDPGRRPGRKGLIRTDGAAAPTTSSPG